MLCTPVEHLKAFVHLLGGPPFVSPVLRGFCRPKNRHSVLPINQLPFLLMFHPWFPTPMDSLPILLSMGFPSFKIFGFPFAIVIAGVTS